MYACHYRWFKLYAGPRYLLWKEKEFGHKMKLDKFGSWTLTVLGSEAAKFFCINTVKPAGDITEGDSDSEASLQDAYIGHDFNTRKDGKGDRMVIYNISVFFDSNDPLHIQ